MGEKLTKEQYEQQQRANRLWPDITYGPSGSSHPYDFEPDSEMTTDAEIKRHAEACRQVEEGTWEGSPPFRLGITVASWGWGARRWWMTREEYEAMIGPIPSESDEVQLEILGLEEGQE